MRQVMGIVVSARRVAVGVLMLSVACVVVGVVPAGAATGYGDVCPSLGAPAFCVGGEFNTPIGVAVDNSSNPTTKGDVYVADLNNDRVVRFDAAGKELSVVEPPGGFSGPIWDAVDPTNGDLYVSDFTGGTVDKFDPSGKLVAGFASGGKLTGFTLPAGVAVDPSNDHLFVAQRGAPTIGEYDSSGTLLGSFPAPVREAADSIAADSAGDVYAVDEKQQMVEYPAANRSAPVVLDSNRPFAVAIDPSTGDIFVDDNGPSGSEIAVYSPGGTRLSSFGLGDFSSSGSAGLAVNATTHAVYASDIASNDGLVFEEGPIPETPVTEVAGEVKGNTAVLSGKLNPVTAATVGYHFAFNTGPSCEGGATTTAGSVTEAEGTNIAVSGEATGLSPKTKYTFCLVATNPFGSTAGSPVSFETTAAIPVVEEQSSSELTAGTAKANGRINPSGASTTCQLEYGKSEAPGTGTIVGCPQGLGEGLTGENVTVGLSGLDPNTTYYFHFIAENTLGTAVPIATASLHTLTAPPTVNDQAPSVSEITRTSVRFSGTINPQNSETSYAFEYGTNESYGHTVHSKIPAGLGDVEVIQPVTELQPETLYHYRLLARNGAGEETVGADHTFQTAPLTPPLAVTGTANNVSQNGATLSGSVDTQGLQTEYGIEIGTAPGVYGPLILLGVNDHALTQEIGVTLQQLVPGTTYHYRVTAINVDGTSYGTDQVFTTLAFTSTFTTPPAALPFLAVPLISFPKETTTKTTVLKKKAKKKKAAGHKKKKSGRKQAKGKTKHKKK